MFRVTFVSSLLNFYSYNLKKYFYFQSCREKCVRFLKAQREVMQLEELSPDGNVVNSIDNGNNDPQNPHAGSEGLQGYPHFHICT